MDGSDLAGADADELAATGRRFADAAERLAAARTTITAHLVSTRWVGSDADSGRSDWSTVGAPAVERAAAFLTVMADELRRHADEQRHASAAGTAESSRRQPFRRPLAAVHGLRRAGFGATSDARDAVVAALAGIADASRIRRDEIEIRALDNGRYIVVLPGVTDLSSGIDRFVDGLRHGPFGVPIGAGDAVDAWMDNDEPTVRKMRYAYEAARHDDRDHNEYAAATIDAMRRAGVPAGADVMLVGHSFGAYAAVDLAADHGFNARHGGAPSEYRVNITHVVAAGADVDWRFDEIPAATNTLVVNNIFDLVQRAENTLHADVDPVHAGHEEAHFWGGVRGGGHDEEIYLAWLAETERSEIEDWFDAIGDRYGSAGERVSVQVPDPNLPTDLPGSNRGAPAWWSRPASIR